MSTTDTRIAFEAWAKDEGLIQESHGIMSINSMCDVARKAFDAGIAHAEAAKATGTAGELAQDLPIDDIDLCAFQNAIRNLEWIEKGVYPSRDHDLDGGFIAANIKHAKSLSKAVLPRLREAYSALLSAGREGRKAARQPASSLPVKTWQERVEESYSEVLDANALSSFNAALAEIADLRAILASTQKGA